MLCTSCFVQKGQWINGQCRPKNPNFKLSKIPFKKTDKLVFNKVYIADNITKAAGYGFLSDGRLICFNTDDGFALKKEGVIDKNWSNAIAIGYWRVEDNKMKIEFFVCQDSGFYNMKQGEIKGDTIIFYKSIYYPTRKEVREEKYILSDMSFE